MAGGIEGNERLTVVTGALLIVLLAAVGVTIVFIGRLLWWHLFLGLALIGPIALKVASTGYRFMRYYTADPTYRRKGPPPPALRALGPALVGLTAIVFASGVALLLIGPSSRGTLLLVHKVSFICWVVVTAVHIAGHLPELARFNRVSRQTRAELNQLRALVPGFGGAAEPPASGPIAGGAGRWLSIGTAAALGLVLAAILLPDYGAWTGAQGLFHHHHHLQ
ncbi:MAG TPA: hypothetical protein VHW96_22875 [Solirubrobacteraceae bacterium]|jgi:hypothetical protein|nr:hypothetical protein [Solirubrobacteraceae bacterium]